MNPNINPNINTAPVYTDLIGAAAQSTDSYSDFNISSGFVSRNTDYSGNADSYSSTVNPSVDINYAGKTGLNSAPVHRPFGGSNYTHDSGHYARMCTGAFHNIKRPHSDSNYPRNTDGYSRLNIGGLTDVTRNTDQNRRRSNPINQSLRVSVYFPFMLEG